MQSVKDLVIGTRGSKLAIAQAKLAEKAIKANRPELNIRIMTIKEKGDTNHSPIPAGAIGKTWFRETSSVPSGEKRSTWPSIA